MKFCLLILFSLSVSAKDNCTTYSYYVDAKSLKTTKLCGNPAIFCPQNNCQASKPICKKNIKELRGGSPLGRACEACGGSTLSATNIASKNKESLCYFKDGSFNLSYDLLKKFK